MFRKGDVVPQGLNHVFYDKADFKNAYEGPVGLVLTLPPGDGDWPDTLYTPKIFKQPDEMLEMMLTQCLKAFGYDEVSMEWLGTYCGEHGIFTEDVTEDQVVEILGSFTIREEELVLLEEKYPDLSRRLKVVDKIYGPA